MRHRFFGDVEERNLPRKLSESDILQQVKEIFVTFGRTVELNARKKEINKEKMGKVQPSSGGKKSIFFNLPYWEFNSLCHNLDVMHIEKNMFDNII